jgi:hypothetical protein
MQLIEKAGAKVSAIVNVIEKNYGEPRDIPVNSRAILGISGLERETETTCKIKINELLMERLETPRVVNGVRYEPKRSLSSVRN